MKAILKNINIELNKNLYLKDPNSSDLGKAIIYNSVLLIDEMGLEHFTFRKLAQSIKTTESTIYRYFENKHKLLTYLLSWYFKFIEHLVVISTSTIDDPIEKLSFCIKILSRIEEDNIQILNLELLQKIIIVESNKILHSKELSKDLSLDTFEAYNQLCNRVSDIIIMINKDYKYAKSLANILIEGIYNQKFNCKYNKLLADSMNKQDIEEFYFNLVINNIKT